MTENNKYTFFNTEALVNGNFVRVQKTGSSIIHEVKYLDGIF